MTTIKTQISAINSTINDAITKTNRSVGEVRLLAVSKTKPAETILSAFNAGQIAFGENYLQEALVKMAELSELNIEWHFIGPIQSNKTRDIATNFDWVQSVDRLKIAKRLSEQRPEGMGKLDICIQVNIDNEASKSGVKPDEVSAFAEKLALLDNIRLRGLMVIPSKTNQINQQRDSFHRAYKIFSALAETYPSVDTLSMGMSGDLDVAIEQGSTMVRVGTALFGQRDSVPK